MKLPSAKKLKLPKVDFPIWLAILLIVVFLLRLPSIFGVYSYGDECISLVLGQAIKKGLVLYRDIHDNKPPLLYLTAAITGNIFWFRTSLLIWGLLTTYVFYRLARIIRSTDNLFILTSTVIFGILSALPQTEGNIANAEVFIVLFILAGIMRLFCGKLNKKQGFIIGFLFSIAALFKIPSATDLGAIFFFLVVFETNNLEELKTNFINFVFVFLGFILPILSTFVIYFFQGAFKEYLIAAFLQNFGYLSSWKGSSTDLYVRVVILLVSVVLLWIIKKRLSRIQIFLYLWFAFSLFGALLSGRPYPHYLVQVLPSACFLFASLVAKTKLIERVLSFGCITLLIFLFFKTFWYYSAIPYYQNFISYVSGGKSFQQYLSFLGGEKVYRVSDFVITHTISKEKIFIWGDSPCIYALSNRLPVGKYTAAYHISDFNGYKPTAQKIIEEKPRFIIDLKDQNTPYKELNDILLSRYSLYRETSDAKYYLLNPSK